MNVPPSNQTLEQEVRARLDSLTKPPGSLGRLEEIALRFALIRGELMPSAARKGMFIFCGDHGVTAEGVSAYPSEVTHHMIRNFVAGGAAINVLCRRLQISPTIVDVGVKGSLLANISDRRVAQGTMNFRREPAMSREQAETAIAIGEDHARSASRRLDMVGIGEMGIGNTACASAILSVYSGLPARQTVGPGTGLTPLQIEHKAAVVQDALNLHKPQASDPIGVLAAVGGFEVAAMAGFLVEASRRGLPVVLDGFITCAAALVARALKPDVMDNVFFGHRSTEPGHLMMLEMLQAQPIVDLEMRLGEGSGAAVAMSIIDMAVGLYREMATFAEAGIGA